MQANIGKEMTVLVEKGGVGRAENFLPVHISKDEKVGSLIFVKTLAVKDGKLLSEGV